MPIYSLAVTSKAKATIREAVNVTKRSAVGDLQKDYDVILMDWDTTKAQLLAETQDTIEDMNETVKDSIVFNNRLL